MMTAPFKSFIIRITVAFQILTTYSMLSLSSYLWKHLFFLQIILLKEIVNGETTIIPFRGIY